MGSTVGFGSLIGRLAGRVAAGSRLWPRAAGRCARSTTMSMSEAADRADTWPCGCGPRPAYAPARSTTSASPAPTWPSVNWPGPARRRPPPSPSPRDCTAPASQTGSANSTTKNRDLREQQRHQRPTRAPGRRGHHHAVNRARRRPRPWAPPPWRHRGEAPCTYAVRRGFATVSSGTEAPGED